MKVGREMNGLYSDVWEGTEERRRREATRGTFMDRVLDDQVKEKGNGVEGGFGRHQLWFVGGTISEVSIWVAGGWCADGGDREHQIRARALFLRRSRRL